MTDVPATPTNEESSLDYSRLPMFGEDEVSPEIIDRTRKNSAIILQSLNNLGASRIARIMGIHDSAISRFKTHGMLMWVSRLFACLGLKIVPESAIVYLQPEEYK
jgi:hypothetical protein